MALKAGYKGVKNSLVSFIESLVGSKVIKSIGDGLSLSDAGELELDIGDGLEIDASDELVVKIGSGLAFDENGAIEVDSTGGLDYSNTEQDTGLKWLDGRSIYQKTWSKTSIDNIPNNGKLWITTDFSDIDLVIQAIAAGAALSEEKTSCEGGCSLNAVLSSSGVTLFSQPSVDAMHVTLWYIKKPSV